MCTCGEVLVQCFIDCFNTFRDTWSSIICFFCNVFQKEIYIRSCYPTSHASSSILLTYRIMFLIRGFSWTQIWILCNNKFITAIRWTVFPLSLSKGYCLCAGIGSECIGIWCLQSDCSRQLFILVINDILIDCKSHLKGQDQSACIHWPISYVYQ